MRRSRFDGIRKRSSGERKKGIALFVVLTSILVISMLLKQLFFSSNAIVDRTRNSADRIQALYLARSTLNLSRLFLMFSRIITQQLPGAAGAVTLDDFWAKEIPFPIPVEIIQALVGAGNASASPFASSTTAPSPSSSGSPSASSSSELDKSNAEDLLKKCNDFFSDFPGTADSTTTDLSSKIDLNSLDQTPNDTFLMLEALLTPTPDFTQSLTARGINYDLLSRQIRDYMDADTVENETNTPEAAAYTAASLTYLPKNRPYMTVDELKLIPLMDNELYAYLSKYVWGIVSPSVLGLIPKPVKINLNTVSKEVFQALLKDSPNSDQVAEAFIKDRTENHHVYNDTNLKDQLQQLFGLDNDKIRLNLLTGSSVAFQITTDATVNQVLLRLQTIVTRPPNVKTAEPIVQMRVYP